MQSYEESISFTLPANKTTISFLQLKDIDKIKGIELGIKFLQHGSNKMQCWNNEEWTKKQEKEREKHEYEMNIYKIALEKSKEELAEMKQNYTKELIGNKQQIIKQIEGECDYTINRLRGDIHRMGKEMETLHEQKNNSFKLAFNDYEERVNKKDEIWERKLLQQRNEYEVRIENEKKEKQTLMMRAQNSTNIGQDGENFTLHELTRMFPKAEIEDTHKERARGDFIFKDKDCLMLIETKNYKTNVTKPEIEKFYRDIDANQDINCGVMISLKSGISAREDFQLEIRGGKPIIFLHNISSNISNLGLAVKLFKIVLNADTIDLTNKETTDKIAILIPILKRNMNAIKQKIQKFNTDITECATNQETLIKDLIVVLGLKY